MIKPVGFRYNEQTAVNNYYQQVLDNLTDEQTQGKALNEFNTFVDKLRNVGVNVVVIEDTEYPDTPDSIFPNNWVSFHSNAMIGLYPMCAENRRDERREDIFDTLVDEYGFTIEGIKDFTEFEEHDKYLEGTGSMVLDHVNMICYAAISIRTDEIAVMQFCEEFGYRPICFTANQDVEGERMEIYHTNVMMCIANNYSIICLDSIDSLIDKQIVLKSLEDDNKEIIEINENQLNSFAGNMIELVFQNHSFLIMSSKAYKSLTKNQIKKIEKFSKIVHSSVETIENCGAGSVRCMIAEVFN